MTSTVRRILMLKGHSAGIGDLLRSTPAWRALKDRYGDEVQLHLVLFTNDPGYVSEGFIAQQALLAGMTVIPKLGSGLRAGWSQYKRLKSVADAIRPDMVIDFEPHGMRSTLMTAALGSRRGVQTVGIGQFPGRSWFYDHAAPAGLFKWPEDGRLREVDYTDRDFAALAALALPRNARPIEMSLTERGSAYGEDLRPTLGLAPGTPLIGINIGCGTPTAEIKRPANALVMALARHAVQRLGGAVVLTGAPNERAINEAFVAECGASLSAPVFDLAGRTDLEELAGAIDQCRLFVSSDSGPYHMAVARRVPTLALFNWANHQAYHDHRWVRRVVRGPAGDDAAAALSELDALITATAS